MDAPKPSKAQQAEWLADLQAHYPNAPDFALKNLVDSYTVMSGWMIKTAKEGARKDRIKQKTNPKSDDIDNQDLPAPQGPAS